MLELVNILQIGIVEARHVDQHKTETLVRDKIRSDILGAGHEVTRFPLLWVPGELVDELVEIFTLVFPDPDGPIILFCRTAQYGDDNPGREYSQSHRTTK